MLHAITPVEVDHLGYTGIELFRPASGEEVRLPVLGILCMQSAFCPNSQEECSRNAHLLHDSLNPFHRKTRDTQSQRNQELRLLLVVIGDEEDPVDVFEALRASRGPGGTLSYVIPISDNGGSSSELIRVFGGPGEFEL